MASNRWGHGNCIHCTYACNTLDTERCLRHCYCRTEYCRIVMLLFEFVSYRKPIDFLYPKKESKMCWQLFIEENAKRRIVFVGHADAAYELTFLKKRRKIACAHSHNRHRRHGIAACAQSDADVQMP
ncbi:MAG: hypothetical protein ACLSB9_25095 [Hydrogeniiclostridium mannosilyticum]